MRTDTERPPLASPEPGREPEERRKNPVLRFLGELPGLVLMALVLAVSFDLSPGTNFQRQIEVTLATRPATAAPDEARHIAQSNQQGSGDEAEVEAVTSQNNQLPMQAPVPQQSAPREAGFFEDFGRRFAALHKHRGKACGFPADNFIGAIKFS